MGSLEYLSQNKYAEYRNVTHEYQTEVFLKEEPMKKYLFGLGAMLVGAGLMFVLMPGLSWKEDPKRVF